jgi:N-acetylmuramic acid 6-phosphate etherase
MTDIAALTTEARSPFVNLDVMSTLELLSVINREDEAVPRAVREELPHIAAAVEAITARLAAGGRLFYCGAGTSGRLGVLDAAECPPTFGVAPDLVQGVIAGGDIALRISVEGAEDDQEAGAHDLAERGCGAGDAVVAIAASGRTPYCLGALRYARRVGAVAIALVCNRETEMAAQADIVIAPVVGPEVLTGSTRMKAGTAQKMVLNMLSTATMIKLGKVYSNLMVDLTPANEKLQDRARRIVSLATGVNAAQAAAALAACDGNVKQAIVVLLTGCTPAESRALLAEARGFVREAIDRGKNRRCS